MKTSSKAVESGVDLKKGGGAKFGVFFKNMKTFMQNKN